MEETIRCIYDPGMNPEMDNHCASVVPLKVMGDSHPTLQGAWQPGNPYLICLKSIPHVLEPNRIQDNVRSV